MYDKGMKHLALKNDIFNGNFDGLVKSQISDGKVKSSLCRTCES